LQKFISRVKLLTKTELKYTSYTCMGEMRNVYKILVGKPEGKRR
jgi:hypothetical protein